MELILQKELPHQQKAVDAICEVFNDIEFQPPVRFYENPVIMLDDNRLKANIETIQQTLPSEYRSTVPNSNYLNLDIKMETGTGKTYVYVKTIYELHKRYGLNKFIIVVPSLAIKAGTSQFLNDDYVKRHFRDVCGYGTDISVGVLESSKNKKGREYFPGVVSDFIKGSCQDTKIIHILLTNMQLFTNGKMLSKDNYDFGAEGFYRPFDALKATRPILIIDEPHRFSREQKAFKTIYNEIKPQCIIRYGATFPEIVTGKGRNKKIIKDYQNLLYDLNACVAFNQGLIKGVAKEHFESNSRKEEKIKIAQIENKEAVHIHYSKKGETTKFHTLRAGDSLSIISGGFSGITVSEISKSEVKFSNGVTKTVGEEIDVDIYMNSYQEQMLRLALQRHFETEKENFCGRNNKIKTLALFFIDDITSYRTDSEGKKPYLLETFECLLRETITDVLGTLSDQDKEYKKYLEASLANISACHAGYFSQDNNDSDESIAKEVDIILNGKKQLLSFKNNDGSYNTLRFLFSKWTLKEGWDNPNVFTIAKLRSSGSENSKLQEVGRGLRLPVDEYGNRISNEGFTLNYIVDFTEANFAQKLVDQINSEIPQAMMICEETLAAVAKKLGTSEDALFGDLFNKNYIDRNKNINLEKKDIFFAEYPDFAIGLKKGRIKDRNKDKNKPIKIRPAIYNEIKDLWEKINQRYFLFYDSDLDDNLENVVLSLFEKPGVFTNVVINSQRDVINSTGANLNLIRDTGVQYIMKHKIPYGLFLKRISANTNIPVKTLHASLCRYAEKHGNGFENYINDNSVAGFCTEFFAWKNGNLQGRFHYERSKCPVGATALTYADGQPRQDIAQGRIGTRISEGVPIAKYLYDTKAYDSPLEKMNIETDIQEVIVYGKIPRNSIAIPTITGGTYSPDFMYVVKRESGKKELNIIVETKDVENKSELRGTEKAKLECAKVFFEMLTADGYTVYFRDQLGNKQMAQIISEILK